MYGVHVEYPPDYDFNLCGTGLEAPAAPVWAGTETGGKMESEHQLSHGSGMEGSGMEAAEGSRGIRDNEVRRPASAIDARPFRVRFCMHVCMCVYVHLPQNPMLHCTSPPPH